MERRHFLRFQTNDFSNKKPLLPGVENVVQILFIYNLNNLITILF